MHEDKQDEELIVESIRRNVHFTGTNLWTLIFAILIASIGLNVNSTAVVIGAMLISPMMGPIMGVGLGIGIVDFELMKKGVKNLAIAASFSILTSALYFTLSPLHEAKTEILARTTPSLWDVMIAFFGGMAGIIAGTRKEKTNVLPGVAIATALMPPLCTAGFGLATATWTYFLGALYLFFINSLFICLATLLIVRSLKFKKVSYETVNVRRRVSRSIWIMVALTVIPSVYLAFRIVQNAIFEQNVRNFVQNEFRFDQTQVVSRVYKYNGANSTIDLLLIGEVLPRTIIDSLRGRMSRYKLDSNWLRIRQGLDAKSQVDIAQIKASILEDVFNAKKDTVKTQRSPNKLEIPLPDLRTELRALYPDLREFSLHHSIFTRTDTLRLDTMTLFIARFGKQVPAAEQEKLREWLKQRTQSDSLRLMVEYNGK